MAIFPSPFIQLSVFIWKSCVSIITVWCLALPAMSRSYLEKGQLRGESLKVKMRTIFSIDNPIFFHQYIEQLIHLGTQLIFSPLFDDRVRHENFKGSTKVPASTRLNRRNLTFCFELNFLLTLKSTLGTEVDRNSLRYIRWVAVDRNLRLERALGQL